MNTTCWAACRVVVTLPLALASACAEPVLLDVRCEAGRAGPFPCEGMDLVAHVPAGALGADRIYAAAVWEGAERTLLVVEHNAGTAFVDLDGAAGPAVVAQAFHPGLLAFASSTGGSVVVVGDFAFTVGGLAGHGLRGYDLSRLPASVDDGGPVSTEPDVIVGAAGGGLPTDRVVAGHHPGLDLVLPAGDDGGLGLPEAVVGLASAASLFLVGSDLCPAGLARFSIAEPTDPRWAGCVDVGAPAVAARCSTYLGPDPDHQGRELCFVTTADPGGGEGAGLVVVDVSDAGSVIARLDDAGRAGPGAPTLTGDLRFLLLPDWGVEEERGAPVQAVDLFDLDAPRSLGAPAAWADGRVAGLVGTGPTMAAAERAEGLSLYRFTRGDGLSIERVGSFDAEPGREGGGWQGALSVIATSDGRLVGPTLENGLVVVRAALDDG